MNTNRLSGKLATLIAVILMSLIAVTGLSAAQSGVNEKEPKAAQVKTDNQAVKDTLSEKSKDVHQLVVYYFYTTQRCASCLKIESFTKEALDSTYSAQQKVSLMIWNMVNIDEKANEHFIEDYQLYTKSVILSDQVAGKQLRWKNLEKVWEHLDNKAAFQAYIRSEIDTFLKAE